MIDQTGPSALVQLGAALFALCVAVPLWYAIGTVVQLLLWPDSCGDRPSASTRLLRLSLGIWFSCVVFIILWDTWHFIESWFSQ